MKLALPSKLNATVIVAACAAFLWASGLFVSQTWAQSDKAGDKKDDKQATTKAALSVSAVSPSNGPLGLQLQANGNIVAWQEAIIGAEVNGLKLTEVRVNVGDVVKKGQVLATFSADSARADVLQAQANLAEAQATAADAAANAARTHLARHWCPQHTANHPADHRREHGQSPCRCRPRHADQRAGAAEKRQSYCA
jgi:multidrug efflux pump subunit AcrA (membrane-fusion protein)